VTDRIQNGGFAEITLGLTQATDQIKYGVWGTGTGQAASATALATAAAPTTASAVAGTQSRVTTTQTNDTLQIVTTISAGGTLAITEFGHYSGTVVTISSDRLVTYHDFSALNLLSGDSVEFTEKIKFS
jgi:hypothetical protein